MKSILDPQFRYTNSYSTDIRKTFARIRRRDRSGKTDAPEPDMPNATNVLNLARTRKSAA
jgi:hypothetical protein